MSSPSENPACFPSKGEQAIKRAHASDGYSLLEILVVLAIIAVLATLVGPRLFSQLDKSKVTTAKTQIQTLATALDTMLLDVGRYPTKAEGLTLLVTAPADQSAALWRGPYLNSDVPLDPWGNAYQYEEPSSANGRPLIRSLGSDGSPSDDDVVSR